jgi:serine/threonine-protein kinase RsbW
LPVTRQIRIASTRANVRLVEEFILALHNTIHFPESVLDKIMISVTEVVNNGIIHGNKLDPSKNVELACTYDDDHIVFTIQDEGPGFFEQDLPNPLEEKNLLKEGGRGIHIVRTLMDNVEFVSVEGGMQIRLTIGLHPQD